MRKKDKLSALDDRHSSWTETSTIHGEDHLVQRQSAHPELLHLPWSYHQGKSSPLTGSAPMRESVQYQRWAKRSVHRAIAMRQSETCQTADYPLRVRPGLSVIDVGNP